MYLFFFFGLCLLIYQKKRLADDGGKEEAMRSRAWLRGWQEVKIKTNKREDSKKTILIKQQIFVASILNTLISGSCLLFFVP
jgi:hypothetical protein